MKNRTPHPQWLSLYLIIGGVLGGLWLVVCAPLSTDTQTGLGVGLMLLLGKLMFEWLDANEVAMLMEDRRKVLRGAVTAQQALAETSPASRRSLAGLVRRFAAVPDAVTAFLSGLFQHNI